MFTRFYFLCLIREYITFFFVPFLNIYTLQHVVHLKVNFASKILIN